MTQEVETRAEPSRRHSARQLGSWQLTYCGWDPQQQPVREALTTLGNGCFATRGALAESRAGGPHYPGTYLAGGFSRLRSEVAGRVVENEDLVNWPNWLSLQLRCEGGPWFALDAVHVLEHEQQLELRRGVLRRCVRFRDEAGRTSQLQTRRLVSMHAPNVAAIELELTPIDWSGSIEIVSALDGRVYNCGVERYGQLRGDHLLTVDRGPIDDDCVYLTVRTRQSRIEMTQAVRTRVLRHAGETVARQTETSTDWIGQSIHLRCEQGAAVRVEKLLAIYSSRDRAISESRAAAAQHVRHLSSFEGLLRQHSLAWKRLWTECDLELRGECEEELQLAVRLHVLHLLQTVSPHSLEHDVGVPARGLHGEAYRGHIFWDELFVFPFLNLRMPHLTRSLLLYRYRRLDAARRAALEAGYSGAMFPWQSGSDGREESQQLHLNPRSGRWLPDETHLQRHAGAAIAYNVWQYYQVTGDIEFLELYGAELLLEIARFFASLAQFDSTRGRYEIRGVVGPDEFHTRYPGAESPGIDNNAYTNVMASWVLSTARTALEELSDARQQELLDTLQISSETLARWDRIARRLYVPFLQDGIISQFEGWQELEELDWERLEQQHGDIQRLDRILEAAGDDPNRYKASKQADVLMLYFLFSAEELSSIFERLGYAFDPEAIPRTVRYYLARTSHGSTLSRVVHAWVLARSDRKRSRELFRGALRSDIDDVQGGTTAEGVHLGAMAGSLDLLQRCYTGLETRDGVLWLNPQLPEGMQELALRLRYRGHRFALRIGQREAQVEFERGWSGRACIGFRGEVHRMSEGETRQFSLGGT